MGWNTVSVHGSHPIMADLETDARFYFVHSYYVVCDHREQVLAETHYGADFASAVVKGNVVGVQFHPEKSHTFGMSLLRRFAALPAAVPDAQS